MSEFLNSVLAFPTVLFSIFLVVVIFYWLLVLVGVFGVDVFDVELDIDADGFLDGSTDGAVEAAVNSVSPEGGMEGADGETEVGKGTALLHAIGIGRVPATIVLSLLILFAWITSFAAMWGLQELALPLGWMTKMLVFAVSIVVASFVTAFVTRPLASVFEDRLPKGHQDLVGRICTITTSRVDEKFGQATLLEGGTDLLIHVTCVAPNPLKKGMQAVIIAYDRKQSLFHVEAVDIIASESKEQT